MTQKETELFTELMYHYSLSREDLDARLGGFDTADELFRSYINEDKWPYSALIFIPKVFTAIFEKTSRLIGNKPTGRLIPREGSDVVGAKINNEILSYQWDDSARVDGTPLIAKWAMMDMNARKYGAAFALVKWHYERRIAKDTKEGKPKFKSTPYFDGPSFQVINNRDALVNPSYSSVKNWFGHREYLTAKELLGVNDAARGEPIYKNLDELIDKLKKNMRGVDRRDTNYTLRNKTIKSYQDYLGSDPTNKIIEVVTEYRENRWITYVPRHGLIIRDIENPYDHQQIPVICLKYYPIDDDIYGLPEWEPVEKLQKGLNAITSQYVDAANMELHSPIGVDSTRVRMHTLELGPNKKWITSGDPRSAITKYDFGSPSAIAAFKTTYGVFVGEMQEGLGETSATTSTVNPFSTDKTATEIKDTASQRLSRDNFNQIFLGEAIKRQMLLWHAMNQQLLFDAGEKEKIIRIVGKDAIAYFKEIGFADMGMTDDAEQSILDAESQGIQVEPTEYQQPLYPVQGEQGIVPKMELEPKGDMASLHIEPEDLMGSYDYIVDVATMQPPNEAQVISAKKIAIETALNPQAQAMLQAEGKTIKISELLEDYLENLGFKDAGKYFEAQQPLPVAPQMPNEQLNPAGAGAPQGGIPVGGNVQVPGMGGPQANPGATPPPFMGGPNQV